jgi:hypothetical protein
MLGPQRQRDVPRISVNKLGEFLTTGSASRRRRLVVDQTKPKNFLANGCTDPTPIADAIARIKNLVPKSPWYMRDYRNTIAALEHFLTAGEALPTKGVTYIKGEKAVRPLVIAGVQISVRPDFILRMRRGDSVSVGAMKINYVKDGLSDEGQEYVAMLCHEWSTKYGVKAYPTSHSLCLAMDVVRHSLVSAPKGTVLRMREIEHACAEIALVWPTV